MSGTYPTSKRFLEQFPRLAPLPVSPATQPDQKADWQLEAMRRGILIEQTIRDFERTEDALEQQIRAEEEHAGSCDPTNVAYSLLARALRERQQNLRRSICNLQRELASARLSSC
jgi:hypothetical protein